MKIFLRYCYVTLSVGVFTATVRGQVPVINSFSPASGPVGTTVTITGTNFSPTAANNIVYFGAVKATVTAGTSTSLAVIVPAAATYQPIMVTTNNLTAYSAKPFNVTFPNNGANFSTTSFAPKVEFATTQTPFQASVIDVDGDGKLDIVYTSVSSKTISVKRNLSSGGSYAFAGEVSYPVGDYPQNFSSGDFDGDGMPDLIVVNNSSKSVSILRNVSTNGTIAFAPRIDYPTGQDPSEVAIADFDGDGKTDFVVASNSQIQAFRNISTKETILFSSTFLNVPAFYSVAAGDFNGDGKPDLATISQFANTVSTLINTSTTGSIAFANGLTYKVGPFPIRVKTGDLDGDGRIDFAVSDYTWDSISIFRNTGSEFAPKVNFATDHSTYHFAIGDLDGDGKPDLAVAGFNGTVGSVLRNWSTVGTIAFAPKVDYTPLYGPFSIALGDVDGDGKPDIITEYYYTSTISILKNQVSATCPLPTFRTDDAALGKLSCGNIDGAISILPTCGVPPFLYSIDGGETYLAGPDEGYTFKNLTAGTYKLRLKDAGGNLSEIIERTVFYPAFVNNGLIVLDASCGNNDGGIWIFPTSGTAPFLYSINGGTSYVGANAGFQNLRAGTYKLRLKDANGCESQIIEREVKLNCTTTCTPPTFKDDALIILDATCANNDGNINIIPTSGTAPFMYSINGGLTYVAGPNAGYGFQNLPSGTYKLRLKDANGCESAIVERQVKLLCTTCTPPTFVSNGLIVLDASCGKSDGAINIIPTSGTAPFMYSINGGATYVAGPNAGYGFQNLAAGTYKLRLKDVRGCESAIVERTVRNYYNCPGITVSTNPSETSLALSNRDVMTTYPNPNTGQFKLLLQNFASKKAEVSIYDAKGTLIQKHSLNLTQSTIADFDLKGKARGLYYLKATTDEGMRVLKVVIQ
jgi:hypothetical protein